MRVGDLIDMPVSDVDGHSIGAIREVRAHAFRRSDGSVGLAVSGVVAGKTRARLFGYERHGEQGPALLRAIVRWLHRHSHYIRWDQIDIDAGRARVRVRTAELPPLTETDG